MLKLRLNTNLTKLNIAELEGQITNGFEKNEGENNINCEHPRGVMSDVM